MVPRSRSGYAFWLFLVLLALGAGWAANQDWRWPLLALFDQKGETDGPAPAPQVVSEQPAVEDPAAEAAIAEPGADPGADPGAATGPAAPAGQDLAAEPPASGQAPQPQPAVSDTGPTPEPAEAEVATPRADPAPSGTEGAAPQAEAAVSEPLRESPEQEPSHDDTSSPASSEGGAADEAEDDGGASTGGPLPNPETEADTRPSFDLVRVGRDGRAVIAGRAAPGAEVEVRSGGQVIDRVHATRRGEWVAIPARPLAAGDQELSAVASRDGTAAESEQVVVVAVPAPSSSTMAVATEAAAPAQPVAVLLPRDGRGAGRILQAPGRLSAEGSLALMTVSYDESGEVLLSGEAPPGVPVRIYVDNRPAALVVGDAKGGWSSGLGEALAPGTYTLRLDQLDAEGQAVARIETPFTRVSEPPVEGALQVDYVVVQPGNSLWRIARRLSGKGLDYVHIYGVNQTRIRNPDLIYPGQVFEIPAALGSAG
jgi:nucleoid-associated protein YgaU